MNSTVTAFANPVTRYTLAPRFVKRLATTAISVGHRLGYIPHFCVISPTLMNGLYPSTTFLEIDRAPRLASN